MLTREQGGGEGWKRTRRAAVPLALLLTVAACGGGSSEDAASEAKAEEAPVMLTFNDRNGGSPYIKVYAGTGESAADRRVTGTYYGADDDPELLPDTMPVDCIEEHGREVPTHPEVGEDAGPNGEPIVSEVWYGLDVAGEPQFATATYANVARQDAARLDPC